MEDSEIGESPERLEDSKDRDTLKERFKEHADGLKDWRISNRGPFALIICLLITVFLTGAVGYSSYSEVNKSLGAVTSKCSELSDRNEQLSSNLDEANSKIKSLEAAKRGLAEERDGLKSRLAELQDQQATINDEKAKLEELHAQLDTLQADRDSVLEQLDAKKLAEERAAQAKEEQRLKQESQKATSGETVYWVSGGEVYHTTPNCPTLKRSKNIHSGSISASGKHRCCKVCG